MAQLQLPKIGLLRPSATRSFAAAALTAGRDVDLSGVSLTRHVELNFYFRLYFTTYQRVLRLLDFIDNELELFPVDAGKVASEIQKVSVQVDDMIERANTLETIFNDLERELISEQKSVWWVFLGFFGIGIPSDIGLLLEGKISPAAPFLSPSHSYLAGGKAYTCIEFTEMFKNLQNLIMSFDKTHIGAVTMSYFVKDLLNTCDLMQTAAGPQDVADLRENITALSNTWRTRGMGINKGILVKLSDLDPSRY